jgi:3-methyladenine DNA glycosylase AlkD
LWDRRIAIIATFYFIKNDQYEDTLRLSRWLLFDKEDLIHKAVGWMLREIGKRNIREELTFLDQYAHKMPRVMLRYAIEQLPERKRKEYLKYKM